MSMLVNSTCWNKGISMDGADASLRRGKTINPMTMIAECLQYGI